MTPAVDLQSVTKQYGGLKAVDNLSLRVEHGEMLTLLGPSGGGKTTLLNMIAGFAKVDSGNVLIDNENVKQLPPHLRSLGVVFQNYALFPHMSVGGNVAFGLKMRKVSGAEVKERVAVALDLVRLGGMEARKPSQLSGGQRQRVALARALVINPAVLLLDEPLSALDKNLRAQMQLELKQIQRRIGVTTICVTHDQGEALSMSDRVAVLSQGVLQQVATPTELYNAPATPFVASFVGETNRLNGTLVGVSGEHASVALGDGSRVTVPSGGISGSPANTPVVLFIRPEEVAIEPSDIATGNVVQATVFQGAHVDVVVDTKRFGTLTIRSSQRVDLGWEEGMPVKIDIRWDKVHAFPA